MDEAYHYIFLENLKLMNSATIISTLPCRFSKGDIYAQTQMKCEKEVSILFNLDFCTTLDLCHMISRGQHCNTPS